MKIRTYFWGCVVALCAAAACFVSVVQAEAPEAKAIAQLKEKGIRVLGTTLTLPEEAELTKMFSKVVEIKKKYLLADKDVFKIERDLQDCKDATTNLLEADVQLNAQLANVQPGDVATNNRLVGIINGNVGRLRLLVDAREKLEKGLTKSQKAAGEVRESYVKQVLDLRTTVDDLLKKFKDLEADEEVQTAVKELNEATGKKAELSAELWTARLKGKVKELEGLESKISKQNITLRKEGNSYYVTVVFEGDHKQEMIVDSGASVVCLPSKVAADCGVTVTSSDPEINLTVADGRSIKARLKTIPSLRVGQFTVENVECAVLGPEATNAASLLGMTFLGKFKFELHAQASELTLTRVEGEPQKVDKTKAKKPLTSPKTK